MLLATLATLAAVVLLIACANVGSLLLGRARARSAEMAIRLAIGVSRGRLLQQLLIESLLLAFIGSALGLVFAYRAIRFFQTIQLPTDLPIVIAPYLDRRVLLVSVLAGVASALLFGLAPAWQSLKTQLVTALKSAAPSHSRTRTLGRNALVVTQVALSMVLLIATGMLLDGFRKLLVMNPGFRTDQLLMLSLDTSIVRYTPGQTSDFYRTLVSRARELPGVVSVSLTSSIPLDPPFSVKAVIPDGYQFARGQETVSVFFAVISEHYFATMKTGLARGRAFTTGDTMNSRRVAIVNEEFAKLYWPDQDPMTKRVRLSDSNGAWLDIVGVVKTGKYLFIGEPPTPFLFLPFSQNERPAMSLLVETTIHDAAPLAAPLRNLVRTLDESQPVFNARTFSSFYQQRAIGVPLLILRIVGTMGLHWADTRVDRLVWDRGLLRGAPDPGNWPAHGDRGRQGGRPEDGAAPGAGPLDCRHRRGRDIERVRRTPAQRRPRRPWNAESGNLSGRSGPCVICLTMIASYFPARRAARVDPLRALRYE